MSIISKVKVIAWLEFEPSNYDIKVELVSHDATGTPASSGVYSEILKKIFDLFSY